MRDREKEDEEGFKGLRGCFLTMLTWIPIAIGHLEYELEISARGTCISYIGEGLFNNQPNIKQAYDLFTLF